MGKTIESIVDEVLKEYGNIVLEATKEAAHKGQKDVMKKAKRYLKEYYNAYPPEMYQRKYALQRAITPYWGDSTTSNMASITIGVKYNAGALKGAYRSNSKWHQSGDVWKSVPANLKINMTRGVQFDDNQRDFFGNFGTPEPNWILDNYLRGEHGGYYNDGRGTAEKMDKFFDGELQYRIAKYMEKALFGAAIKRM